MNSCTHNIFLSCTFTTTVTVEHKPMQQLDTKKGNKKGMEALEYLQNNN